MDYRLSSDSYWRLMLSRFKQASLRHAEICTPSLLSECALKLLVLGNECSCCHMLGLNINVKLSEVRLKSVRLKQLEVEAIFSLESLELYIWIWRLQQLHCERFQNSYSLSKVWRLAADGRVNWCSSLGSPSEGAASCKGFHVWSWVELNDVLKHVWSEGLSVK